MTHWHVITVQQHENGNRNKHDFYKESGKPFLKADDGGAGFGRLKGFQGWCKRMVGQRHYQLSIGAKTRKKQPGIFRTGREK